MNDFFTVHWPFFIIYVERGFAAFGWYSILFPQWVYSSIVAVVAAMAVSATWMHRSAVKSRWRELAVLAMIVVTVVGSVHSAFFAPSPDALARGPILGEQGRHFFTALVPLGLLIGASCYSFGSRRAGQVAATLLSLGLALAWASQLLAMQSFFA